MSGPNRWTEGLLEHADVVASTLASNNEIRANIGDATRGTGIDASVPFWGTDGFFSRPADPTVASGGDTPSIGGAAQYLFYVDGQNRYAIGSRDRRYLNKLGQLQPGDRAICTPTGIKIFMSEGDGSIVLSTPQGAEMVLSSSEFTVTFPNGASYSFTPSGVTFHVPTTPLPTEFTLGAGGAVFSTPNPSQQINLDAGMFVTLGLTGGVTRPGIPTVENVNIGPGGGFTIPSPRVFAASA
jgi:hypothetical protein